MKSIDVREGQQVALGDRLLQLTLEARLERQREAEAQLSQIVTELEGARTLSKEGYAARQRVQKLESAQAAASAQLARIKEEIADTEITAPYDGVVNHIAVERNQFVAVGNVLATMIDNSVLRVGVDVAQHNIADVEFEGEVNVDFATGLNARGRTCFISASADPRTRTFLVEIWVPNRDRVTPSGISADVRMPLGIRYAHLVSAAVLSLDDKGRVGIKSVDEAGIVQFNPVEIVQAAEHGIWVAGAPSSVWLITMGQGFVKAGERVRVSMQNDEKRTGEVQRNKVEPDPANYRSAAGRQSDKQRRITPPGCNAMRSAFSEADSSTASSTAHSPRRSP